MAYLVPHRKFVEAMASLRRAEDLDPLSVRLNASLALVVYMMDDYEGAKQAQQTLELDPHFGTARLFLALAQLKQSRYREAIAALEGIRTAKDIGPLLIAALGQCYAAAGDLVKAREVLRWLLARSHTRYIAPIDIARVHIGLGDYEQAFKLLHQALRQHCGRLIWLGVHPMFAPLRSDKRFVQLLSSMHLKA